jgi:hypothetical protein
MPSPSVISAAEGSFGCQVKENRMQDAILVDPTLSLVLCFSAAETIPRFE